MTQLLPYQQAITIQQQAKQHVILVPQQINNMSMERHACECAEPCLFFSQSPLREAMSALHSCQVL